MADNIADFYSGDTKTYKFEFGNGLDITGWKVILSFKEAADDTNSTVEVSNTAGDNPSDDIPNGVMFLTMNSEESYKLDPDTNYSYSFKREIIGSNPANLKTLTTGVVDILQSHKTSI